MTTTTQDSPGLAPYIFFASFAFWTLWTTWLFFTRRNEKPALRSVAILVLGDIGRSPRMMYHAESFAKNNFDTFLIGNRGSKPVPSLTVLPHVHLMYLSEPPPFTRNLPFILFAPIKVVHQVIAILTVLVFKITQPPEFILVQNPPSIPTLALVWLVGKLRGSKVIIDWHNLGYSILAMKLGQNHILVKIAKKFEATFGRTAYAHLFVTQAMHDYLVKEWDLKGRKAVLHDRPPRHFHRASTSETHELFLNLQKSREFLQHTLSSFLPASSPPYSTPFTQILSSSSMKPSSSTSNSSTALPPPIFPISSTPAYSKVNMPTLRPDRPALIVSSTSWTPDEDFGILLDALCIYEKRAREVNATATTKDSLPKLLVVITGKGPLRLEYMQRVGKLQRGEEGDGWKWVRCISLWLEAGDYPLLLGSADLGVCLHSSSSALDLPMKVVDMFGCGLPVCALNFACLDELVKDGQNGLIFSNATQLATQFENLLTSFPESPALESLRSSLVKSSSPSGGLKSPNKHDGEEGEHWEWNTWEENWKKVVRPLILSDFAMDEGYWRW